MENSKNATRSLYAKGPLFFNIGLIISISLCFIAFEYKVYIADEETVKLPEDPGMIFIVEEVKPTIQPPKPKPFIPIKKKTIPKIVDKKEEPVKKEDKPVEIDLSDMDEFTENDAPTIEDVEAPPVDPWALEVQPEYINNGLDGFYKYLANEINYPRKEQRMGIDGKVYLTFIIEKDGSLTDIKVLKGVSEGLDQEAIRVLESSPEWSPGKQRGQAVRVRMTIPINFQLN
ncbi:energy transducer TonB [Marivirga sp. S37H4]|uniref:Energy transducer TonB n=1 Tax=Marivirga aurantiaca TaxID=2802615 RepID=A0A934X1H6_9BACT|nr:energy transducer TonB [Marivirga aurantiaca]MBK6266762.1 energy transducer TonB [Marivirga aurantiaca]